MALSRGAAYLTADSRRLGLFLASGLVATGMLLPIGWMLIRALSVDTPRALGILFRARTLEIILNSIVLMTAVTVLSVVLAVPLAVITVQSDLPFRRLWTVIVSLPLTIPSYLGAFAIIALTRSNSPLAPLGLQRIPGLDGLTGAIIVITLYTYPYVYLTTRAALKTLDPALLEAAYTLNHNDWETFKRITFPQIRPAVAAGALLVALYAISDFGTPAFMRADVFTRQIYLEQQTFGGADYATFLSLQLVLITIFILILESRIRGAETLYTDRTPGHTPRHQLRLGPWKWPILTGLIALATITLVLPVGVFFQWLAPTNQPLATGLEFQWIYVTNSVLVAGVAALAAALAALPVAYCSVATNTRIAWVFERATYVGYAVPGIVIGLALVFFGTSFGGIFYQSIPILIFAYVIRFMPQSVGATRTSLLQVNPRLIEAAYTLGRGPLETFRSITLPLIAPGIIAGAALVFLTTMKELPATLLLRPTGFETLVTRIWAAESASLYGHAAVPALILIVVSGLSMLVLLRQEDLGHDDG